MIARAPGGCLRGAPRSARYQRGFTLVELIVTITLSGIVLAFIALFAVAPIQSYFADSRRGQLVGSADLLRRSLARDVRTALPNSVRIAANGNVVALELLAVADVADYWDVGPQALSFGSAVGSFQTLGAFASITTPISLLGRHLAIGSTDPTAQAPYALGNVTTPAGTTIRIVPAGNADTVTLTPAGTFGTPSPTHKLYLLNGPVSYLCDSAAQTLTRYTGYTTAANQNARASAAQLLAAGATASAIATGVTACRFGRSPGAATHAEILIVDATLASGGEILRVFEEFAVEYLP